MSERVRRTIEVHGPEGLHGRPASRIVRLAREADAEARIVVDGEEAPADSVTRLRNLPGLCRKDLAADESYSFEVVAEGPEAEELVDGVEDFVRHRLTTGAHEAVAGLRRHLTRDRIRDDLVALLERIEESGRATEEDCRRLRFHRDLYRWEFGRLAAHLGLDDVRRQPPEGVSDIASPWARRGWSGEGL